MMEFVYATGGREKYFKAMNVGDCVTRAIANATGIDYKEIYDRLAVLTKTRRFSKRERVYAHESPRNGVFTRVAKKYIEEELGWVWVPCMTIGSGCKVHLTSNELPSKGNIILNLSKHFSCVKDGVLYDTYDCSRDGSRCVYGYWRAPSDVELKAFLASKQSEEAKKAQAEAKKAEAKRIKALKAKEIKRIKDKYMPKIREIEKKMNKEIKAIEKKYEESNA